MQFATLISEENPLMEANTSPYRQSNPKQQRKGELESSATEEDGARLAKKLLSKPPTPGKGNTSKFIWTAASTAVIAMWTQDEEAQEICHGHGSGHETVVSGRERGGSGQRGFSSELFGKRP